MAEMTIKLDTSAIQDEIDSIKKQIEELMVMKEMLQEMSNLVRLMPVVYDNSMLQLLHDTVYRMETLGIVNKSKYRRFP